jgi:hypothetical protein
VLEDGFGELAGMPVELAGHAEKRTVILAIEKIRIRTVRNSNANNRGYEKILHIRIPLEPSECPRNKTSIDNRTAHSARRTAAAQPTAISCLGAFLTPAVSALDSIHPASENCAKPVSCTAK